MRSSRAPMDGCARRSRRCGRANARDCACATVARTSPWKGSRRVAETEPTIEEALTRLETIADRREDPSLGLGGAGRLYEEGLRLHGRCAKRLDAAELRITQLAEALQKQARG